MHVTDSKAPGWLSLLKQCAEAMNDGEQIVKELFPGDKPIMALEECASIIQVKMHAQGKCLHTEIAKVIGALSVGKNAEASKKLLASFPELKFITTNYDLLIEKGLLEEEASTSYSIGYPINRQPKGVQIYHVHGSVKYPKKMVVTADDYFRFINNPDYFSRKVQTLIEESTTVIIGYSLGDVNFKSILNSLRSNRAHDINRQNLFFLSRRPISKHVRDYYDRSYGLRVVENTEIDDFFKKIVEKHKAIKERVPKSRELLMPVLERKKKFTDSYLKKRESFYEIVATLSSNGIIVSHPSVVRFLKDVIRRKREFTGESGAWEQYDHLAGWLVQLGAIMDIKGTAMEEIYLEALEISFGNMSKKKTLGRSWDSFRTWKDNWLHVTYDNRLMICEHLKEKAISSDASEVIAQ